MNRLSQISFWTSLTLIVIALLMPSAARADVPSTIDYQGILKDDMGVPQAGIFSVTFRIWSAETGGAVIWSETQTVKTNNDGLFNVLLGGNVPLDASLFDEPERYLGVTVAPDLEMDPRTMLVTVPYAYRAASADALTHGGVHIQAIASECLADAGGTGEACVTVTVDDIDGALGSLVQANFFINTHFVPPGGGNLAIASFANGANAYRFRLVPASGGWLAGSYHLTVTVLSPQGNATTPVRLDIDL